LYQVDDVPRGTSLEAKNLLNHLQTFQGVEKHCQFSESFIGLWPEIESAGLLRYSGWIFLGF
jgi:hypothetical protein